MSSQGTLSQGTADKIRPIAENRRIDHGAEDAPLVMAVAMRRMPRTNRPILQLLPL